MRSLSSNECFSRLQLEWKRHFDFVMVNEETGTRVFPENVSPGKAAGLPKVRFSGTRVTTIVPTACRLKPLSPVTVTFNFLRKNADFLFQNHDHSPDER